MKKIKVKEKTLCRCKNIYLLESASTTIKEISFTRRRKRRNDGIAKIRAMFVSLRLKVES